MRSIQERWKKKEKKKKRSGMQKKELNKTSFVKLLFIRVQIASTYSFSLSKFAHSSMLK